MLTQTLGNIAAHGIFTFPNIYNVFIGWSHFHRTNGAAKKLIRNIFPIAATIDGFPNTTAGSAKIECILALVTCANRTTSASAKRTEQTIVDIFKH